MKFLRRKIICSKLQPFSNNLIFVTARIQRWNNRHSNRTVREACTIIKNRSRINTAAIWISNERHGTYPAHILSNVIIISSTIILLWYLHSNFKAFILWRNYCRECHWETINCYSLLEIKYSPKYSSV